MKTIQFVCFLSVLAISVVYMNVGESLRIVHINGESQESSVITADMSKVRGNKKVSKKISKRKLKSKYRKKEKKDVTLIARRIHHVITQVETIDPSNKIALKELSEQLSALIMKNPTTFNKFVVRYTGNISQTTLRSAMFLVNSAFEYSDDVYPVIRTVLFLKAKNPYSEALVGDVNKMLKLHVLEQLNETEVFHTMNMKQQNIVISKAKKIATTEKNLVIAKDALQFLKGKGDLPVSGIRELINKRALEEQHVFSDLITYRN